MEKPTNVLDEIPFSLTRENFWNESLNANPAQIKRFCDWLDKYQQRVSWKLLFNECSEYQNAEGKNAQAPSYYNLPIGMQLGIFMEYVAECNSSGSQIIMACYIKAVADFLQKPIK